MTTLGDLCLDILLRLALMQPDPAEREAMLQVLRDDGWISADVCAHLVVEAA